MSIPVSLEYPNGRFHDEALTRRKKRRPSDDVGLCGVVKSLHEFGLFHLRPSGDLRLLGEPQ